MSGWGLFFDLQTKRHLTSFLPLKNTSRGEIWSINRVLRLRTSYRVLRLRTSSPAGNSEWNFLSKRACPYQEMYKFWARTGWTVTYQLPCCVALPINSRCQKTILTLLSKLQVLCFFCCKNRANVYWTITKIMTSPLSCSLATLHILSTYESLLTREQNLGNPSSLDSTNLGCFL